MAAVLDFMRDLRDQTGAAVVFVHHTGHAGGRMRGTSDLEAYWESKLSINREQGGVCTLKSEHREAEAGEELRYTLAWDEATRSLRLSPVDGPSPSEQLADDLLDYLAEHPGGTLEEVRKGVRRRKSDVRSRLLALEEAGTACSKRSQRVGTNGNAYSVECWYPASAAGLQVVPLNGNAPDPQGSGTPVRSLEHDRERAPSTLADYRSAARNYLFPAFGENTPIEAITTARIDDWRELLLAEGRLSRRTVQKAGAFTRRSETSKTARLDRRQPSGGRRACFDTPVG
jgi:hypothetical protein